MVRFIMPMWNQSVLEINVHPQHNSTVNLLWFGDSQSSGTGMGCQPVWIVTQDTQILTTRSTQNFDRNRWCWAFENYPGQNSAHRVNLWEVNPWKEKAWRPIVLKLKHILASVYKLYILTFIAYGLGYGAGGIPGYIVRTSTTHKILTLIPKGRLLLADFCSDQFILWLQHVLRYYLVG